MYDIILVRYGEIALKGENRSYFVNKLIKNIRSKFKKGNIPKIEKTYGRIFVYPDGESKKIIEKLKKIPGIVSVSQAVTSKLDFNEFEKKSLAIFKDQIGNDFPASFRITTNRANKDFPRTSPEVSRDIGAYILKHINQDQEKLTVDLENPDYTVNIEIRDQQAYIFTESIPGPEGLPVGTSEKGLLLLSGGIDSPVAGWSAMRRGIDVEAVYFHSYPFTGDRAREKVIELSKILAQYTPEFTLNIAHFTEIQKAIQKNCPRRYYITIMRRMMFRLATKIARQNGDMALITGESLGQVASQTLESISVISQVTDIPVLRPLITRDKKDIVATARKIGTYETSIQPYEDCCTIMVPDHPVTKPRLTDSRKAEEGLKIESLIDEAIAKTETITFDHNSE